MPEPEQEPAPSPSPSPSPSPPHPQRYSHHRQPPPQKMSLPNPTTSRSYEQEGSSSSSPWSRRRGHTPADSLPHHPPPPLLGLHSDNKHKVEDSDEDLFRVPDVEAQPASDSGRTASAATTNRTTTTSTSDAQHPGGSGKRRRGRNPVDREYRRLKRLLRNRVSAQQARERKKVYVNDLESRAQELQDRNSKLEEKISTLANENTMLRKVLMNTRPKMDESSTEPKRDQLGKS